MVGGLTNLVRTYGSTTLREFGLCQLKVCIWLRVTSTLSGLQDNLFLTQVLIFTDTDVRVLLVHSTLLQCVRLPSLRLMLKVLRSAAISPSLLTEIPIHFRNHNEFSNNKTQEHSELLIEILSFCLST